MLESSAELSHVRLLVKVRNREIVHLVLVVICSYAGSCSFLPCNTAKKEKQYNSLVPVYHALHQYMRAVIGHMLINFQVLSHNPHNSRIVIISKHKIIETMCCLLISCNCLWCGTILHGKRRGTDFDTNEVL